MMKVCSACKVEKPLTEFYKTSVPKCKGYKYSCKSCESERNKKSREKHKERVSQKAKEYRAANREKLLDAKRKWDIENREHVVNYTKEYREKNIDILREKSRVRSRNIPKDKKREADAKYRQKHLEKLREFDRQRNKTPERREYIKANRLKKLESRPELRVIESMRSRVRVVLKEYQTAKVKSSMKLFGCDPLFLRQWIESQFEPNMTWDNYGEWHVDHVIPVSAFNMLDKQHQELCFHYRNLQPMWGAENTKKSNKIDEETIERKGLKEVLNIINP